MVYDDTPLAYIASLAIPLYDQLVCSIAIQMMRAVINLICEYLKLSKQTMGLIQLLFSDLVMFYFCSNLTVSLPIITAITVLNLSLKYFRFSQNTTDLVDNLGLALNNCYDFLTGNMPSTITTCLSYAGSSLGAYFGTKAAILFTDGLTECWKNRQKKVTPQLNTDPPSITPNQLVATH